MDWAWAFPDLILLLLYPYTSVSRIYHTKAILRLKLLLASQGTWLPLLLTSAHQTSKRVFHVTFLGKLSQGVWVCGCVCVCVSHSVVSKSATPWTVAHQAPPSRGFSRQGYWSGLPFPSPRDLPDPGTEPESPALQADALLSELLGKPT